MASLLITSHAVAIGDAVFVLLGVVQLVATILVLAFATKYEGSYCATHLPLSCTEPAVTLPNDPVGLPRP